MVKEKLMSLKGIGVILLGALGMMLIMLLIDINFYNDTSYTKGELNKIIFWAFIKGLVFSVGVNIAKNYFSKLKDR